MLPSGREERARHITQEDKMDPRPLSIPRGQRTVVSITAFLTLFIGLAVIRPSICFAGTVTVSPGENIQSVINSYSTGTTFVFTPGIYRLQTLVPKSYDSFVGQTGAIISGAKQLTTFSQNGSYWVANVKVTKLSSYPGYCDPNHPNCMYPEDLFFNNVPRLRASNLSGVHAGTWYLDYSTGNVYMGDNPSGHTVEISLSSYAFSGSATNVSITSLIVEKYATLVSHGAIDGSAGKGWKIATSEIRYNHGVGLRVGTGMWAHDNQIHDNGQLGMGGSGSSIVVQSNEIRNNNYAGYNFFHEAGGAKFTWATGLTIQYNYSHDNFGPGLNFDANCSNALIESNRTGNNQEAGILYEISYNATIRNNYISQDGYNVFGTSTGMSWGAGILITNSSGVQVYGNTVKNCMNGIGGLNYARGNNPSGQPYLLQNLSVHNNAVTQAHNFAEGIVKASTFDNSVFTSWNNHFQSETYYLTYSNYDYFCWLNQNWTLAQWNEYSYLH